MAISERENILRTIEMRDPEWVPCFVNLGSTRYDLECKYAKALENLVLRHPSIKGSETGYHEVDPLRTLGSYDKEMEEKYRRGKWLVDEWGCEWYHVLDGVWGEVKKHPLEDWSALDSYRPPPHNFKFNNTPLEQRRTPHSQLERDWDEARRRVGEARDQGRLTVGDIGHDFLFLRLTYLRGFNNFMKDTITEPPQLKKLIDMVAEDNMKQIGKWLEIGVDMITFGDDLGTQKSLMINPKAFRKIIFPAYAKFFGSIRAAGTHVFLHTDGHVLEIADDLVKAGVSVLNIRIFQNEGIGAVKKAFKGKVCLDVGTDRQVVIPWGSPKDVKNYVRDLVLNLGSKRGGLILVFNVGGLHASKEPLANIEALFEAIEEYKYHHWK